MSAEQGWTLTKWWYGGEQAAIDAMTDSLTDSQINAIQRYAVRKYAHVIFGVGLGIFGLGYNYGGGKLPTISSENKKYR